MFGVSLWGEMRSKWPMSSQHLPCIHLNMSILNGFWWPFSTFLPHILSILKKLFKNTMERGKLFFSPQLMGLTAVRLWRRLQMCTWMNAEDWYMLHGLHSQNLWYMGEKQTCSFHGTVCSSSLKIEKKKGGRNRRKQQTSSWRWWYQRWSQQKPFSPPVRSRWLQHMICSKPILVWAAKATMWLFGNNWCLYKGSPFTRWWSLVF